MSSKSGRRNFLKKSVLAGASIAVPYFIPANVLARPGIRAGANDKVILGGIGVGNRFGGASPGAGSLAGSFASLTGVEFGAMADADLNRAKAKAAQAGSKVDAYQDYRKILERSDIDAVIVASPDHWHAQHSIEAAMAGKDIYCEKALTLTVEEGRAMVNAVRKHKRILQTGSQQRSWPGNPARGGKKNDFPFYRGMMLIRNGYLGKINKVVGVNFAGAWENALPAQPVPAGVDWDKWMGPVEPHPFNANIKESRSKPGWLSIKDFCGGEICGWGAHDLDQVQWALGMDESGPEEVWVEGTPYKPWIAKSDSSVGRFFGAKETIMHYTYPGGIHLELSENADPNGGALFIGDKGRIKFDRNGIIEISDESWLDIPFEKMKVQVPKITNHSQNFIDCIKSREKPIADVEIGHRSATVGHLGNIARWVSERTQEVGVKMKWDSKAEKFTNSEWGNHYLSRPRRAGYSLKS